MFQWIKQLLCSHRWINPSEAECLYCGYKPRCKKHNIGKYFHGYWDELNCLLCDRETKEQLNKKLFENIEKLQKIILEKIK